MPKGLVLFFGKFDLPTFGICDFDLSVWWTSLTMDFVWRMRNMDKKALGD